MPRKGKTHDQFASEYLGKVGEEYELLNEYSGSNGDIWVRHNSDKCENHKWKSKARKLLEKNLGRCPKCNLLDRTKTNEQFLLEVKALVGEEYIFLEKYKGALDPILAKHNTTECGYEYPVSPANFIYNGRRCPNCFGKFQRTHEEFVELVFELVGNEYSVVGEYKTARDHVEIRHNNNSCDYHTYSVQADSFTSSNARCPKCANNTLKTTEEFAKEVYDLVQEEYIVLGEYIGADKHIMMKHNNESCDFYEWSVRPVHFTKNGTRCPKCNDSKGVVEITRVLKELGISYIREYRIEECRHIRPLPFDIAIFDGDNKLSMLIEYDGKQHFEPQENWGGQEGFEGIQLRDGIKDDYCIDKEIPLLRIAYTDFDRIEEILRIELKTENTLAIA